MKFLKLRFLHVICLLFALNMWAQDTAVSGQVTDETGLPVPGASVLVKGTQNSTSTDIDGKYQIMAGPNATLVISFVGYATIEEAINSRTTINVSLAPSVQTLEEVVVVGYGTQKKSVVTGAISSVKAAQLENLPLTRVEQSLQGRVSGVTIFANAGQPGSSSTVRVRGLTSFGNSNPLFIIDGVQTDNVSVLNQSDIESIEVLKDAASAAIYGTRAANGVILINTKKGKKGKMMVNYNGFAGSSQASRKLDLLDATQYATLRNEQYANGYTSGEFRLPFPNTALGKGTDWQSQIFNKNAQRSQHELSLSGGNDTSNFFLSFGLLDQEGIVTSDISQYNRKTIRLNSDHKITKWLTVGEKVTFSREKNIGLGNTNGEFGGPLASAINLDPTTPAIVTDPTTQPNASVYQNNAYAVRDANGNYYGISNEVQQEITNPLAYTQTRLGNYDWADNFLGSVYAEITPLEGLKLKSQVTGKQAYYGNESFTPISYLNANNNTQKNSLFRSANQTFLWNIENTISYNKLVAGHNFTLLVGQAAYVDNIGKGQGTTYQNQPVNTHGEASFNWPTIAADITSYAYTNVKNTLSSYFARFTYDYKERYLLTGIVRRDGSSKFGANYKYGTFPSFSAGWNISKEAFWKENNVVNQLKLRGGYGVTGNDNIQQFGYLALIGGGYNYTIGTDGNVVIGNTLTRASNPNLRWEETTMTNIGIDATVLTDLTLSLEYYRKATDGILGDVPIPAYVGTSGSPRGNVAAMKNTGFEIEAAYRKNFGDLHFTANGNFSTLKNTITDVGPGRDHLDGPTVQSYNYPITRSEVGSTYNGFYGFVNQGIFQNQAEIDGYKSADGTAIQPDAKPGDFKWADLDGDGTITEKDRKYLGQPMPDFTYGLTLNFEYKGVDLTLFGQGVGGNTIFQGLRRLDIPTANWQTSALNRWNGEGTSNTYPRLTTDDRNGNFTKPSNFYLQDGDYFRLKVVQLGYSLPNDLLKKVNIAKIRIYATAENLLTFTKYTGYDPEIGGDVMGIDRGYYPQARSFMLGCNLQF
ncbi:SusC/RagA family TonB-linked outer membrane protein [Flavobacterium sp. RHBU_24]|uniref:SusC/RagA family TonB-linked outer membrane protein n=1 Tax=Flavobacterium sp. RHBU_24 TaxID=3391185 RepID=UPI003984D429